MRCKKCGIEMRIMKTETRVEGDKSPDTETKVFAVQMFGCINPSCEGYCEKEDGPLTEVKHEIYSGQGKSV